jgi:hypothetical protein
MKSFPTNIPAFIAENEAPEKYLMKDLPRNGSITNWMFSVAFKPYLIDANAVVLTMPINYEIQENEYFKPYPRIFTSAQVIDYKINEFYLLQDGEELSYEEDDYYYTNGRRFFLIQPDIFQVFEEKNGKHCSKLHTSLGLILPNAAIKNIEEHFSFLSIWKDLFRECDAFGGCTQHRLLFLQLFRHSNKCNRYF